MNTTRPTNDEMLNTIHYLLLIIDRRVPWYRYNEKVADWVSNGNDILNRALDAGMHK